MKYFLFIVFSFAFALQVTAQDSIKYVQPAAFCTGDSKVLTADPTGAKYQWQLNGADISGATNSSFTATSSGKYTVIVDGKAYKELTLTENTKPTAGFTTNPNTVVCSNTPITFTNTSANATSYTWDFGDPNSGGANSSTAISPTHTFIGNTGNTTQSFTVTLTARSNPGCFVTTTQTVKTNQIPDPSIADYTTIPPTPPFTNCGSATFNLVIDNTSKTVATNTAYKISWGDGSPDFNSPNLPSTGTSHNYNALGYFNLVLTVTGNNGCTIAKTYKVYNGSNPEVPFTNPGSSIGQCVPFVFTVPSITTSNPPGTEYIISKNDGSSNETISANQPPNYTHIFTQSSCGASGGITPNTFFVNIRAQNPCGFSDLTIQPITTSIKPKATFTVNPDTIICLGTPVTITNTSINGITVNNQGQCNQTTQLNWLISPSSGWALTAGVLGNNNPTLNPGTWGSNTLNLNFTQPGNYKISIIVRNSCGNDTLTKTICVNPLPTASFSTNITSGCSPLAVTATGNTNTPSCGTNKFIYSVSYQGASGCNISGTPWSFANNTNTNSQNPQFLFKDPGTYTISLVVQAPNGSCSISANPIVITVKDKPVAAIPSIASICQNGSINPTVSSACFTSAATYAWNLADGVPATSNQQSPGTIVFNNTGNKTISVAISNECGTTNALQTFSVQNITQATTGPAQTICGSSATLSANAPSSGIGIWTRISGPTSVTFQNPNAANTVVSGLITGNYIFKWTISISTCSTTANDTVNVIAGPTPSNAGPDQSLCEQSSANLAGNTPLLGTGNWQQMAGPTVATITNPANASTTVTGLTAGSYTFRWTISYGNCQPSTNDVLINVYINPTTANAGQSQTICTSSVSLTGNPAIVGQVLWTKVSGTGGTINLPTNSTTTVSNLTTGDYVFRYTISNGSCLASSSDVSVKVTGNAPAANAGPDQNLCAASTITLNGNNPSPGTGKWTLVSGPSGSTFSAPSSATTIVNGVVNGTYVFRWTISNGVCSSTSDDVQVTISDNVTPANAGPDQNKCGNTATMAGNSPSVGNGTWSFVSGPAGSLIANANSYNTNITGLVPGTYVFRWKIDNGTCSSAANVTVVIQSGPTAANAGKDQSFCKAGSLTLTGNTPSVGTGSWQFISGPDTPVIATPNSSSTNVTGLKIGSYVFRYTISFNNCTPSTDEVTIVNYDEPSSANAGNDQTICSDKYQLNATAPLIGNGIWSVGSGSPNNLNFSSNADPKAMLTGLVPGTYTLNWQVTNGPCAASNASVKIIVTQLAPTAAAGTDFNVCYGNTTTLNANNPSPGTGLWTLVSGPGVTIVSPSANNSQVTGLNPGLYKFAWTINNGVCPATSDTVALTVLNSLTNKLSSTPQTICSGQSASITGQLPTGGSGSYVYQWQQSTNGSSFTDINGETNKDITVSPLQNTWYRRYVKSLPCEGPSDTVQVTVLAGISSNSISANQSICINTKAATIVGQTPGGGGGNFTYAWEMSADSGKNWTLVAGATGIDYDPGVLKTTTWYRRLVTTQLCNGPQGNASNMIIITVNPDAIAQINPLTTRSCAPFVINSTIINLSPYTDRNGNFIWWANGNIIGNGNFPGYTLTKPGDSVQIRVIAVSKYGCKNDTAASWFYSPENPAPVFKLSDTVGCGPLSVTITNNTPNASQYRFTWNFGNGITSNQQDPGSIVFNPNPLNTDTTYNVIMKATGGCDTITVMQSIRVKSKPKALFTPSKVIGCSPMTVTFTNTSRGTHANFTWNFGDGSAQQPASGNTIQHTFYTGVLDTFFVKLFGQNECGIDTQQYAIVVNPNSIKLNMAVNGNQVNGCAPQQILFVNNTKGANIFRWNFGDGSPELITIRGIDSVTHVYTNTGNYTVVLSASNSCSDTSTSVAIRVETKPAVSFTSGATNSCIGQSIQFTNTGGQSLSYLWKFGDGTTSNSINPQKTFTKSGTYHVTLIGIKTYAQGFGCSDSAGADIIVRDTLAGNYTVDSSGSCAPMFVVFKNTNKPSVNTTWTFGDGTSAAGDSVVHSFNLPGTYHISMVAQSPGGCKYLDEKNIVVNGPSGDLVYKAGYACLPSQVSFEVNSNNTSTYQFYFGNGDSLAGKNSNISYTYPKPGSYLPSVVLITGNCIRRIAGADSVKIDRLNAGFIYATQYFCGSTILSFTDTSAAYFGIKQWYWDFGDGTSSTQKNPTKQFATNGNFNITLRITSVSGCTAEITVPVTVKVNSIPVSQISNDALNCTANNINFSANVNAADTIAAYNWNFGNGATAQGQNVAHTYSNAGIYTVTLISRTKPGCADTVKKSITIKQSPNVVAGVDARICLGQSTTLSATGSNQLSWSPQQGLSCTTCNSVVAKPALTTLYTVTGLSADGCPDTDSVLVEVVQPFNISVTANDTICIGGSAQLFASGASYYRWNPTIGLNSSNIANPIANPATTTRYTVVGYDNYNCFTDTATVELAVGQYPVVNIGNGAEVIAGTAISFTPVITNGPISKYVWDPPTWLSCSNCATPVATINNNISYQLTVTNIYGCSGSDTISYQVLCSQNDQVYIPNAFSPDGDGINDVFMLHGKGIVVDYFRVFNRWGQLVFDGGSNYLPNVARYGWDGKINGKPATQDVYVYMVKVTCTAGGTFTYKGNVSLLYLR